MNYVYKSFNLTWVSIQKLFKYKKNNKMLIEWSVVRKYSQFIYTDIFKKKKRLCSLNLLSTDVFRAFSALSHHWENRSSGGALPWKSLWTASYRGTTVNINQPQILFCFTININQPISKLSKVK